jgi:hypothetical protein
MELGSYYLFLQEQIKDIIINPGENALSTLKNHLEETQKLDLTVENWFGIVLGK